MKTVEGLIRKYEEYIGTGHSGAWALTIGNFRLAITEYRESIVEMIDEMIDDCKKLESKYYFEGNKDAELQHWNRRQALTELKNKLGEK